MLIAAHQQPTLHPDGTRMQGIPAILGGVLYPTHILSADCAVCLARDIMTAALHPAHETVHTLPTATENRMDYLAQA